MKGEGKCFSFLRKGVIQIKGGKLAVQGKVRRMQYRKISELVYLLRINWCYLCVWQKEEIGNKRTRTTGKQG